MPRLRKKWLYAALTTVILLPLLVIAGVLWLGATESGTRWLVARAQPLIPAGIHWQSLEGRLLGELHLRGLSLEQPGLSLTLAALDLHWHPARLARAELAIETLELKTLRVSLDASEEPEEPSPPFDPASLDLPFDLRLAHLRATDIEVTPASGASQRIDLLELRQAALSGSRFELQALTALAPQGRVAVTGAAQLSRDLPLDLTLDWQWQLPDARRGAGQLTVAGDLHGLQLEHRGTGDLPLDLEGELRDPLGQPGWTVTLSWPQLAVTTAADSPVIIAGQLQSEGTLDAFQLALNTGVSGLSEALPEALFLDLDASGNSESLELAPLTLSSGPYRLSLTGPIDWRDGVSVQLALAALIESADQLNPQLPERLEVTGSLGARYSGQRVDLAGLELTLAPTPENGLAPPQAPPSLNLQGAVDLPADADPVLDGQLRWQSLQWPLQAAMPEFASAEGSANIRGTAADWALELEAASSGAQIPPARWRASATGDAGAANLDRLEAQLLEGVVLASGRASWSPVVQWDIALQGNALEPGRWQPVLAGQLDFAAHSAGTMADAGPRADVVLKQLRGSLGGRPLLAQASANIAGETVQLKTFALSNGDNRINAQGQLSPERLALDWDLSLPQPENLLPEAAGQLQASGRLSGSAEQPVVSARWQGSALQWQAFSLAQLSGNLAAGLAPAAPLELMLEVGMVEDADALLLESMRLGATGTTAAHTMDLSVAGVGQRLQAQLSGGLLADGQHWEGQLASLDLFAEGVGNWVLEQAAPLALAAEAANLQDACLQGAGASEGRACIGAHWSAATGSDAKGRLEALPLGQWLPDLVADLTGDFVMALAPDGRLQGHGDFAVSPGQVQVDSPSGRQVLAHGGGRARVDVGAQGLAAFLSLQPLESGYVGLTVALPAFDRLPLEDPQPLAGSLQATLPELSGIQAWVPQLEEVAGRLDADLLLSGTLAEPRVLGQMALAGGAAKVPVAGLSLEQFALRLHDDPTRPGWLALDGGLRSGDGSLALSGGLSMRSGAASLTLQGDKLEVFNTDDGRVLLSPDLQMNWSDQLLHLRGRITIPRASITPKLGLRPGLSAGDAPAVEEGPATVQVIAPSPDVIILGAEEDPLAAGPGLPFRLDSEVELVLGDRITVDALGLKARLAGSVRFINRPGQPDLLPLADGQLTVEGGTFVALGQELEIQSGGVRFDKVPVTEPEVSLRAVRWIDNDPTVSAAGVEVSGTLDSPRMDLFSNPELDPTEIQSYLLTGSAPSDDSVLGIGTYLHPKLYVGYGYNLLEETSEFTALYTITPRYGIEANVGEADNNLNMTIIYER